MKRFLALFTFLPMEEIEEYRKLEGAELRKAKEVLAYEATKIVHGENEAKRAREASRALFSRGRRRAATYPQNMYRMKRWVRKFQPLNCSLR